MILVCIGDCPKTLKRLGITHIAQILGSKNIVQVVTTGVATCIEKAVKFRFGIIHTLYIPHNRINTQSVNHFKKMVAIIINIEPLARISVAIRRIDIVYSIIFTILPVDKLQQPVVGHIRKLQCPCRPAGLNHSGADLCKQYLAHHVIPIVVANTGSQLVTLSRFFAYLIRYIVAYF